MMSSKSITVHRITKNQSTKVTLNGGYISLDFGSVASDLRIEAFAQWQHVFKNKETSLTTRMYLYDSSLYDPENPSSTARKLLGQNEVLTVGSIRNPLYLGKASDVSFLEREHLKIELKDDVLHFTNLHTVPVTIKYHPKED